MKKTRIFAMLALGLCGSFLVGAVKVDASIVKDQGGQQTIDNSIVNGTTDTEGKIDINGSLGFNSSDPNSPEPLDPAEWIKVTFPTSAIFRSNVNNEIKSPKYNIKNESGRPVSVSVANFNFEKADSAKYIESLSIKSTSSDVVGLSGKIDSSKRDFMYLDSKGGNKIYGGDSAGFEFIGKCSPLPLNQVVDVHSTLTLKFTPLKQDGTSY